MKINQAELDRRLNSNRNLVYRPGKPIGGDLADITNQGELQDKGATVWVPETPVAPSIAVAIEKEIKPKDGIRIIAGALAAQGVPAKQISSALGLSPNAVIGAKNSKNPKIKGPIQATIAHVQELAIDKMMLALGLMTQDKFENAPLKDLSIVAANMGKIIEKTTMKESDSRVQLIIYAPEARKENSYRMIDI